MSECKCSIYDDVVEVKFFKTHPDAKPPQRTHEEDTGYDVFAVEDTLVPKRGAANVPTGIDVAYITPGYWFKVETRSGLSFKHNIQSHPGIIDQLYRGPLSILLRSFGDIDYQVKKGDRIAQIVIYKRIDANISFSDTKDETTRGENGLGSSGR